jgi:hypothetical protein
MVHIFLSYSRSDRDLARRLHDDLCAGGVDVWSDRDLGLGGRWLTEISLAISRSQAVVLLATPSALASKWVMREVGAAQVLGIAVVPLLAGGTRYSDLPMNLAGVNGIDLADGYNEAVELVVSALGDFDWVRDVVGRGVSEARRLLLVTTDENLVAAVRRICKPLGLLVDRYCSKGKDLPNFLAKVHIAMIDSCVGCDKSFIAGYVAGCGGWVICLADDLRGYLPAVTGLSFGGRGSAALEREIYAAAFLPRRSQG